MASAVDMLDWKAEWKAEGFAEGLASGMLEARREDLIKLLRVKYHTLPPELNAAIRNCTTIDYLTHWFDAALAAPSIEAFAVLVRNQ
jgi:hypothetical protein